MYVNQVTSCQIVHTLKYLIDVSKPKSSRSWTKLKLAFGVLNFKEVKKYTIKITCAPFWPSKIILVNRPR